MPKALSAICRASAPNTAPMIRRSAQGAVDFLISRMARRKIPPGIPSKKKTLREMPGGSVASFLRLNYRVPPHGAVGA